VLYTYGSREQCERFLPDIRNSNLWWAQGYSEPGAGSDLARVATRAVRDGTDWLITGRKIWTTYAHWADMLFAIVRTEDGGRPQQGLSFMLIDLHSPGITIRPIETIDGCHHLNEVTFDDVRVPADNLIGEPGKGWLYSKFLLGNERLLGAEVGRCAFMLQRLEQVLSDIPVAGQALIDDPRWRARTASLQARLMSLESLALSLLAEQEAGEDPGARASTLKLLGSHIAQDIDVASLDAVSVGGPVYQTEALDAGWTGHIVGHATAPGIVREYLHGRANTIVGGSSEIQKNIIAKAVLGL
jgi:alkylation response protein AidB-like acyl-CoA dehydrogenase